MKRLRYNIYQELHRELRAMLLDLGMQIQHTDFNDVEATRRLMNEVRVVIRTHEQHVKEEDQYLFHQVSSQAPYIVAMFEKAAGNNTRLGNDIADMSLQFEYLRQKAERSRQGNYFQHLFFEFTAAVLQTMTKEELVINDLLWTHYTDRQILDMKAALIPAGPLPFEMPERQPVIKGWLGELKQWVVETMLQARNWKGMQFD